jgi:CHRD domain
VLIALALTAAACGSSSTSSAGAASPSTVAASPIPSPTPTPTVPTYKLNGINTTASGSVTVTAVSGSVTIALTVSGLPANSSHVSHVHLGSCEQKGGIAFALNQVVADGQGTAHATTTVSQTYPPTNGTWYVVVHAGPDMQATNATYLLCGNLFT